MKQRMKQQGSITNGHLNPNALNSFDRNFMRATYTLTNAAPTFDVMNELVWAQYEQRIRQYAKCPCGSVRGGTLYLLTGTSNYGIKKDIADKVVQDTTSEKMFQTQSIKIDNINEVKLQIPRAFWTAGCCVWNEVKKDFGLYWENRRAESFAVMCNNQKEGDKVLLTEMSVAELELLLTEPQKPRVNLFPGFFICRNPENPDFKLPQ